MQSYVKWLLILLVIGCVGSAIVVGAVLLPKRAKQKYLTAAVTLGRVETVVNSTGTIKPVDSVSVGAFVSGPIAEVCVGFNSEVTKDQVLARIDDRLLKAAVDRDQANLDTQVALLDTQLAFLDNQKAEQKRVKALLDKAERDEVRAVKLFDLNPAYISGSEKDDYYYKVLTNQAQYELTKASIRQAEAAVNQARAGIRQADETLKNSTVNLGYTVIRSPVDGIVAEKKVDKGQTVAASFQTPELFIIAADLEKEVDVHASVDEADIGMIRIAQQKDQAVTFTVDAFQGKLFPGEIKEVRMSFTTVQNVVTYPVVIRAPNEKLPGKHRGLTMKLMPGMTANITFHIEAKDDVRRVPAAALRFVPLPAQVRPEDRSYLDASMTSTSTTTKRTAEERAKSAEVRRQRHVWVEDGGLLCAVPVTLGLVDRQFAEIVAGELEVGQAVVTGFETTN